MNLIANLYYFPPISYCAAWITSRQLFIESSENYQKKSLRNKCELLGHKGRFRLSVPLKKGKHSGISVQNVQIAYDEDWIKSQNHSITMAYSHAPFFEHYWEIFIAIINQNQNSLYTLNMDIMKALAEVLDITSPIRETKYFERNYPISYQDIRDNFGSKPSYPKIVPYQQVFSDTFDFESELSILDLLFCKGPEARLYLKQLK